MMYAFVFGKCVFKDVFVKYDKYRDQIQIQMHSLKFYQIKYKYKYTVFVFPNDNTYLTPALLLILRPFQL